MMANTFFFGYGSLVNTRTHEHTPCHPARLAGWQRAWRQSPGREQAFLTVLPAEGVTLDGLIAGVEETAWEALDAREFFYRRLDASDAVTSDVTPAPRIALYSVPEEDAKPSDGTAPILLSYLDVVLQGYLDIFGEAGALRFFETTTGWETPILNDRAAPLYPRAQTLSAEETAWIDDTLSARSLVPTR